MSRIKSLPNEKWKGLLGYEGYYEVSNMGRVKSLAKKWTVGGGAILSKPDTLLKLIEQSRGYIQFVAEVDCIHKSHLVQTAVYDLFGNGKRSRTLVVQHINGILSDNRIDNLHLVALREISRERKKRATSKYTGVSWHKKSKKWDSRICINGVALRLGTFATELEASNAYQKRLAEIQAPTQ